MNPAKTSAYDAQEVMHLEKEKVFTAAEVATAIKDMKSGKATNQDEISLEMLKTKEILWLKIVRQIV